MKENDEGSEEMKWRSMFEGYEFYDDLSGQKLDTQGVVEARRDGIRYPKNRNVYTNVPRQQAQGKNRS